MQLRGAQLWRALWRPPIRPVATDSCSCSCSCRLSRRVRPTGRRWWSPGPPGLAESPRLDDRIVSSAASAQGNLNIPSHQGPAAQEHSNPAETQPPGVPDHRYLATEQQLFLTHPVSPGSPLFLPNGARIFHKLQEFLRAQYAYYGFEEVLTPTIYKKALWETSGHWDKYSKDMFVVTGRGASGTDDEMEIGQDEEYGLKPMNCPGHCLLFKSSTKSYRDLPVRYADFSPLHRNEISGSLSGLTRVRRFHQDDAHIFCRPSQISSEISATLEFIDTAYKVFRLPGYKLVLSTRPDNHIGTISVWDRAEAALKQALDVSCKEYTVNAGDGAFYGPKIDIILNGSDGKEHQTATVQLDFQLPARFNLLYQAPVPELERKGTELRDAAENDLSGLANPVIIHRAVFGSLERFMALLIEHYNGRWPFWLSPRQAVVIPVINADHILSYARAIQRILSGVEDPSLKGTIGGAARKLGRRTFAIDIDTSGNSVKKKIRQAKEMKYNFVVVVGERNIASQTVTVNSRVEIAGDNRPPKPEEQEMSAMEAYDMFINMEKQYL